MIMNILLPILMSLSVEFVLSFDYLSTDTFDYCNVEDSRTMQKIINLYEKQHNKRYKNTTEKARRMQCLADKVQSLARRCKMKKRSNIKPTFSLTLNMFADLTPEEYHRYLGYIPPASIYLPNERRKKRSSFPSVYSNTTSALLLRKEIDWRNDSCISPVQMQGACGSCWAFAALGAIESHFYLKINNATQISLSVQNLVDCSQDQGNQGCEGGAMENAYGYIIKNTGINLSITYPYVAYQNPICKFQRSDATSQSSIISGWSQIEPYNEEALMQAIAMVGPVAAAIDASSLEFQLYKSGVLCHLTCSKLDVNHGILIVGYKTVDNIPVWIIKNSWSTRWGMNGYCYVCRNTNFCGIATTANFPVLANTL